MQRALSTYLFKSRRLTPALLAEIQQHEIPLIEIFCTPQHLDYRNRAQVSELAMWLRDSPLKVHSVHAPQHTDEYGRPETAIDITEAVKSKRVAMVDEIKRALEVAEMFPFRYLIQHMGVSSDPFSENASIEKSSDAAFSSLEELKLFAHHRGVEILLENIPNEMSTCEGLLTFLQTTHLDLNVCFDSGHAHLHEGFSNAYRMLKPRIRSTHLHDNNGKDDAHQFPLAGSIDWVDGMELLRSAPGQYPLLLEIKEAPEQPNVWDEVRRTFDRLEELKPRNES